MNLSDISKFSYLLKIFFINICTFYTFLKSINKKKCIPKEKIITIVLLMVISVIITIIKNSMNSLTVMTVLIFLLSIIFSNLNNNKVGNSLIITIFCLTINYIVFFISVSVLYVLNKFIGIESDVITLCSIAIIHLIVLIKILGNKKIKYGFSFFNGKTESEYIDILILNISAIIILSTIILANSSIEFAKEMVVFIIIFIVAMIITIIKAYKLYYKQKLLIKDLDETKEELAKTKEELAKAEKENLEASKRSHSLVHRQKALEFQISELRKSKNSKDINKIKQDVENLSKELYGKEVMTQLSKTNIELIDNMFRYMQFECYKNEIRFDLQICGNIYKMINNVINKETLEILLADHIKNAIIAVKHSENSNKSILVKLGKIDDCYGVCIYDSGIEFKEEILKTLGKKPSSTHLDEGGSGMGFLNTFDTLNKYKASLIIDEIGMPCEENYTKVIMIKFDGKNEFKVNSYRQQKAV